MRPSGRRPDELRAVSLEIDVNRYAEGSCLVRFGHTAVLCTASVEETIAWFNELDPGPELEVVPETEHFFHGKLVLLRNAVKEFVGRN